MYKHKLNILTNNRRRIGRSDKHAVQGQIARTKLSVTSEPIQIFALSPCVFTSNHQLPADPAFCRRFYNYHYPKDDKPSEYEIKEFKTF